VSGDWIGIIEMALEIVAFFWMFITYRRWLIKKTWQAGYEAGRKSVLGDLSGPEPKPVNPPLPCVLPWVDEHDR
jgi:hypothetical protein